ncbi:SRPBCC family protein [Mucilaginibacter segetis]|uniref:SRPBCC family protein n=1 Tax=Mucilaginibacter segetis TaxID=2793071 RepID=UPI001BE3F33C|nr:SRPBCC family protein [Mucilaginibacter segetis]
MQTHINAPLEVCFDASRNIDLHVNSMEHSREKAVGGVTSGLINLNDWVTWEANHFGLKMKMTVKITEMKFPDYFVDEMIKGPFKLMRHSHFFKSDGDRTIMSDEFIFKSPFGLLGKLVDELFLKMYMERLLTKRNIFLKTMAENSL